MEIPWKKVKSNVIYETSWVRLYHDEVIRPDGDKGIYTVVKTRGGIGVVPITENNEIVLVTQYRYAPEVFSLEIPKGSFNSFESNENPLEAAQRELKEEAGIIAQEWTELSVVHTLMGASNDKVYLYLAKNLSFGPSFPEPSEDIRVFFIPLADIAQIIRNGILVEDTNILITDATSIAAIYLAKELL